MNRIVFALFLASVSLLLASAFPAKAQNYPAEGDADRLRHDQILRATLNGSQAVPAILTSGRGEFRAYAASPQIVRYEVQYSRLTGGAVEWISIHLGQSGVNGGFIAVLCGINKPPCPLSGNLQGSITAADIRGPTEQGIPSKDMAAAMRALHSGDSYVVIRTTKFLPPTGEIRGQIRAGKS